LGGLPRRNRDRTGTEEVKCAKTATEEVKCPLAQCSGVSAVQDGKKGVRDEWHLLKRKILFFRHSCESRNPVPSAFRESPKALDPRFRGDDELK
jgi:hypothetical protein